MGKNPLVCYSCWTTSLQITSEQVALDLKTIYQSQNYGRMEKNNCMAKKQINCLLS